MDSLRGFDDDAGWAVARDDEPAIERPPSIGVDERRMHVRAYNYWVSLLGGRPYPSIEDLKPERIGDFGPHSVLLDFSQDADDPRIAFLGTALKSECGLGVSGTRISEVPSRSLLSRLTDHYLQIIANRAPIGFEAEFVSDRGVNTMYRGILMPLATDGEEIDFIYGVINWKELADASVADDLAGAVDRAIAAAPTPVQARSDLPAWADGPHAELPDEVGEALAADLDGATLSLWPAEGECLEPGQPAEITPLPADAGLADRLDAARAGAEQARSSDHRSRAALYRALGLAWDFAVAARAAPGDYAEIVADAGIKVQARAPMTAVAKLVFGAGYDKTRLTEFAAALSWAGRNDLSVGGLSAALDAFEGGLKGIVAAERAVRRPQSKPDRGAARIEQLRAATPVAVLDGASLAADIPAGDLVVLVGRVEPDGRIAILASPLTDPRLLAGAVAKVVA